MEVAYKYLGPQESLNYINVDWLWSLVPWERRGDSPRFECWMAQDGRPYTYGKGRGERTYLSKLTEHSELANPRKAEGLVGAIWPPVYPIWYLAEILCNTKFEGCFLNGYKDGTDHLGWHSDDGPDIDESRPIAVVTFGAEREIWLRKISGIGAAEVGNLDIDKIKLQNSSLFIMEPGCQQTHQHRIPKADFQPCGPRISLTFRGLK